MRAFQWIVVPLLCALALFDALRLRRQVTGRRARLARIALALMAAGAVAFPELTQLAAAALGIGRGADVVLYFAILLLLWLVLHFHARACTLEQQLAALVRHLALAEARRSSGLADVAGAAEEGDPGGEGPRR